MGYETSSKSASQNLFLYLICGIAALSGLLFGYDTGVISGAILFIRKDFGLTDTLTETVVSAVLLGALLGSAFGGKFTDSLGRKKVLVVAAITFVVGSIISALSPNELWLAFSRMILGIAIGVSSFAAPLYLAEIAPSEARGKLVSLNQLAITIGILASYIVDYALADQGMWRWMLGIGVVPAVILLAGLAFLPESPRWMIMQGREEEARGTLLKINRTSTAIETEILEIRESLKQSQGHWKLLLADWVRPALMIALGLAFFQQTTGINTIIYYAPTILQMAGFQQAQGAILATLGLGLVNVLATVVALPLIDRWGRRPLLLSGLVGMCLSLILAGFSFFWKDGQWIHELAVGSMVLYIISFAMSLGPVCWLMISEVFPLRARGLGVSLASSVNWTANLIVAMTFLTLVSLIGPSGTFWLYAAVCILAGFFVYGMVPETKGRTLEQIEASLRGKEKVKSADSSSSELGREIQNDQKPPFPDESVISRKDPKTIHPESHLHP